jgi:periplasmic copper chaperone A
MNNLVCRCLTWTVLGALLVSPLLVSAEGLEIKNLWVREGPPTASVLAAYGEFYNPGDKPVTFIRAESNAFAEVQFHQTTTVYGMTRMRQVERVEIPAGGRLKMAPGGMHLMLMKPGVSIRAGSQVELVFSTDLNRQIRVIADVRKGGSSDHHHH